MTTPKIRLFNLDLHISVIEDIRNIVSTLYGSQVEITNWSISNHNFVFGKPNVEVNHVNQDTWMSLDKSAIELFQREYGNFLRQFDGFIVTHTPVFSLLYEIFDKPILIINTCRYNQPYCIEPNPEMESYFKEHLLAMVKSGQARIISNNLADAEYLRAGTGIESQVIPSLCGYTNAKYNPTKAEFIIQGNYDIFPKHPLLCKKPDDGYTWQELYSYKGIIHTPYEMSTMSIFEQITAGVPLWFPTPDFYLECIMNGKMEFESVYDRVPMIPIEVICNWLKNADFYVTPYIHYYSSFDDLIRQIESFEATKTDLDERSAWLANRRKRILADWNSIFQSIFMDLFATRSIAQIDTTN